MIEICNILFRKLTKIFKFPLSEVHFLIINIIMGLVGNQLACMQLINNWWLVLVRMLYFLPFYGLGIFYKNIGEKYDRKTPGISYFTVVLSLKLIIIFIYGKAPVYTASWCNDFSEGPVMPIIIGYLGIAFWLRIATIVEPVIGRNKYINLIADNTYSIMMN